LVVLLLNDIKRVLKEPRLNSTQLEKDIKALYDKVEKLEERIEITEDIEAIKKLQKAYSYYLEHWEEKELLGLWSHSPDVTFEVNDTGQFKGWEDIKKAFRFQNHYPAYGGAKKAPPEYLHILPSLAGIVDVDSGGKTAKGRWYGYFLGAMPREGLTRALIGCGIWENEYVKESETWKLKKVYFNEIISSPLEEGWVKKPSILNPPLKHKRSPGPGTHFLTYPSGYIFPYHYKNPVTGK
jgi:hypothetical protein